MENVLHTPPAHYWSISKMLRPRCSLRGCISPSGVCSTMSPHLLSTYTSTPSALFIKPFWPCSQSKSLAPSSFEHRRHSPNLKASAGILCDFSWFVSSPLAKAKSHLITFFTFSTSSGLVHTGEVVLIWKPSTNIQMHWNKLVYQEGSSGLTEIQDQFYCVVCKGNS